MSFLSFINNDSKSFSAQFLTVNDYREEFDLCSVAFLKLLAGSARARVIAAHIFVFRIVGD